jgi:opacity protein-like surface antigen
MYKNKAVVTFLGLVCASCLSAASDPVLKPFYAGVNGGFGSTTWRGLVPSPENKNFAIGVSTPFKVKEGGGVWGVFTGYEFTPYFALEANYRHYPSAKVSFDEYSIFASDHDGRECFNTDTYAVALMAKVMLTVPKTTARIYSSLGLAGVHRADEITNQTQLSPSFGAGLIINVTPRFIVDFGFNYTAGYGESELNPSNSYIPFLYSGSIGIAYRV